jgi:hypothetical protein
MLLGLLLQGCASTWESEVAPAPQTYSPPRDTLLRGAGKLRRLLLLPAVVTSTDCPEGTSDRERATALTEQTGPYLEDWKGYEVFLPGEDSRSDWRDAVDYLGSWQTGEIGEGRPPPNELLSTILKTASQDNADGFIVIHGKLRCLNALDMTLYFMVVGMPHLFSKAFEENLSAGIYEAKEGRLIWLQKINVGDPMFSGAPPVADLVNRLFYGLENAIPEVLLP